MVAESTTPDLPVTKWSRWFWLRVVTSLFFGLLTVALVMLWVRSYRANEIVSRISSAGRLTTLGLTTGGVYYVTMKHKISPAIKYNQPRRTGMIWRSHGWQYHSSTPAKSDAFVKWEVGYGAARIVLPIWMLASFTSIGICTPWYTPRFSLRTLLIVTTLAAVVLGLVVWMAG